MEEHAQTVLQGRINLQVLSKSALLASRVAIRDKGVLRASSVAPGLK